MQPIDQKTPPSLLLYFFRFSTIISDHTSPFFSVLFYSHLLQTHFRICAVFIHYANRRRLNIPLLPITFKFWGSSQSTISSHSVCPSPMIFKLYFINTETRHRTILSRLYSNTFITNCNECAAVQFIIIYDWAFVTQTPASIKVQWHILYEYQVLFFY